jgi:hypothetical protein
VQHKRIALQIRHQVRGDDMAYTPHTRAIVTIWTMNKFEVKGDKQRWSGARGLALNTAPPSHIIILTVIITAFKTAR